MTGGQIVNPIEAAQADAVEPETAAPVDPEGQRQAPKAVELPPLPPAPGPIPPRTPDGRIHYVIAEHGTTGFILKSWKLPPEARVVDSLPLARLTEDCLVSALVKGKVTEPVPVAEHWEAAHEMVARSTFLGALGRTCVPLTPRVRDDILTLRWA